LRSQLLAISVLLAGAAFAAPASAGAYEPCPSQPVQSWMGTSEGARISIPSMSQPNGITSYNGTIFRPKDPSIPAGPRPLVVLQHGLGGNQCGLHWAARMLAGHGYTSMVWTAPNEATSADAFINALDATRSAIAFARSGANPYAAGTDTTRITVAGHSMGSIVASYVQGDGDPGVRAIVALDSLRRWLSGDPGAAAFDCTGSRTTEVTPTVPALGFAKDEPCSALPDVTDPDLKLAGFEHWRAAGVPAMELVMRGFDHGDFAGGGSEQQYRYLSHYWLLWMRLWIDGDETARDDLLATSVDGVPTQSLLSEHFLSGAYLPPAADTSDFAAWLTADRVAPSSKKKGGPSGRVRKGKKLVFKFKANEPATFECKLDKSNWRKCRSPKRVKRAGRGRHTFRVRATYDAGNRENKALIWKFRVVG